MKIALLYFDGCPSWRTALERLKAALQREGLAAEIEMVLVSEAGAAARLRFQGSPSFQVEGVDLWPEERLTYDLSCRLYRTPEGLQGAPTVDMLCARLSELAARGRGS